MLPNKLCDDIEKLMNRFWWVSNLDNTRAIRWTYWDKLYVPKKFGGMGFRKIKDMNLAMLGKQAWRLLTNSDSLVARLLKARYYPTKSFWDAHLGNNPSFIWRSILTAKDHLKAGCRLKVKNGESIRIWQDP